MGATRRGPRPGRGCAGHPGGRLPLRPPVTPRAVSTPTASSDPGAQTRTCAGKACGSASPSCTPHCRATAQRQYRSCCTSGDTSAVEVMWRAVSRTNSISLSRTICVGIGRKKSVVFHSNLCAAARAGLWAANSCSTGRSPQQPDSGGGDGGSDTFTFSGHALQPTCRSGRCSPTPTSSPRCLAGCQGAGCWRSCG